MTQKKKRYYKVGEVVFVKEVNEFATIKELDVRPADEVYKAVVELSNGESKELNLWEINKDRRKYKTKGKPANKNRQPAGLNKGFYQVRDFHLAFGHPVAIAPMMLSKERAKDRVAWTVDEVQREFLEATDIVGQVDAVIDGIYFLLGTLVEMGVKPNRLFDIVQNANMGKLFPDGKPQYRADGKIKKPDNWERDFAPESRIKAEIERQIELATSLKN